MNRKTWLIGGGGLLVLFLLYRWYASQQAASSTTAATGADTTGTTSTQEASDYASLAGAIQQDEANIAGLQTATTATGTTTATTATGTTDPTATSTTDPFAADLASILSGQSAQTDTLTQALAGLTPTPTPAPAAAPAPAPVYVYVAAPSNATPNPSSGGAVAPVSHAPSGTPKLSALNAIEKASGYIAAPFGVLESKIAPKSGYTIRGLGGGNWAYVPATYTAAAVKALKLPKSLVGKKRTT